MHFLGVGVVRSGFSLAPRIWRFVPMIAIGLVILIGAGRSANADEPVSFSRDVLPILSDNCFLCHGPDPGTRKADLRLDTQDGALRIDEAVIVPGKSDESEVIVRIASDDPSEIMPPPKSNRKLTPAQVETLRRWIDEGAKWGKHWSYEPVHRPRVPSPKPSGWAHNPIDQFVLAKLEAEHLEPSAEALPEALLRRVSLDLTGLPPRPEEIAAFRDDRSPMAYERAVDRLLASPRYGERMAWDWLDAARYADSNGYQGDSDRTMWPWRDWVVRMLNRNQPYDEFTVEQIAGDLLPNATLDQKIATGFCRNHMINGEGGRIPEENRVEYVMDQAETVATVWLGLTFTCSRCHDHKYDPFTQRDYYKLFAFFNQTPVDGTGGSGQAEPVVQFPWKGDAKTDPKVMVMQDMPKPRETFVLTRGSYDKHGEAVEAGYPESLHKPSDGSPMNRLGLARWLTSPENPLTARVTVNRAWQTFFGVGLVKSAEDFGVQGQKPSHPELLDWLAAEFVESGWDVKHLHRLIITSATYRQTSRTTEELAARDPENRLLARGARFRMPSWMIRDQALAASGLLVSTLGGPSVMAYQPPGVWEEATFGTRKYEPGKGADLYRRSLYTFWRRIVGPTGFFDTAARQVCVVKPTRTNSPLHALTTLNDETFVEAARALAESILHQECGPVEDRITAASRRVLGRGPRADERSVLLQAYDRLHRQFAADPESARRFLAVGESPRDEKLDAADHAALAAVCLAILNLDEALTKE